MNRAKIMPSSAFPLQMSTRSELIFKNASAKIESEVCKSLICKGIDLFLVLV